MIKRLLKLIISVGVAICDAAAGLIGSRRSRCSVLYYHAVKPEMRVRFASQMDLLKRISTPIDIEDPGQLEGGARYAAVTFDDGFISVLQNALPELRARSIPCVIFVPSGTLGKCPTWIPTSHPDAVEEVVTADGLRDLASDDLVSIGSHSRTHPNFTRISDEEARLQLSVSKRELEAVLGRRVAGFSFPHGAYTSRSLELARECGYSRIYTIEPREVRLPPRKGLIGRVKVEPHDWPIEFRLKVLGAYRWMVYASALKRKLLMTVNAGHAGEAEGA